MTAIQKLANRAKTKPLQVKFKRLSLNIKTYLPVSNGMPIATRFVFISLFGFNYTLFSTVFCVTFRASRHSQLLKWKSLFYQILYLMNKPWLITGVRNLPYFLIENKNYFHRIINSYKHF